MMSFICSSSLFILISLKKYFSYNIGSCQYQQIIWSFCFVHKIYIGIHKKCSLTVSFYAWYLFVGRSKRRYHTNMIFKRQVVRLFTLTLCTYIGFLNDYSVIQIWCTGLFFGRPDSCYQNNMSFLSEVLRV